MSSAEECNLLDPNACGLHNCGGNSWSPDETQGHGDSLSLKSGPVNMIGASRLCMKARGPGLIKFVWQVDPTAQHVGTLSFWDGGSLVEVCDSSGWSPVTYSLREDKDYDLSWQFQKIKSYPEGAGAGWIDNLDVLYSPVVLEENGSQIKSIDKNASEINSITDSATLSSKPNDISISASVITINTPNIDIKLGEIQNVSIDLSSIQGFNSNLNSSMQPNSTYHETNRTANSTIVGDCNCSLDHQIKRYDSINDAIANVREGGIVYICPKMYNESFSINKSIKLFGESNLTTIIASNESNIINVNHDDVEIYNISIMGSGNFNTVGINVKSSKNFVLRNCNISNCYEGLFLENSSNSKLYNNQIFMVSNPDGGSPSCVWMHKEIFYSAIHLINSKFSEVYKNKIYLVGNKTINADGIRYESDALNQTEYCETRWKLENEFNVSCCKVRRNAECRTSWI